MHQPEARARAGRTSHTAVVTATLAHCSPVEGALEEERPGEVARPPTAAGRRTAPRWWPGSRPPWGAAARRRSTPPARPAELGSSIPSMVPVSRQSRLPSTMLTPSATETSQTRSVPAMAVPTTLPTTPTASANSIAATPDHDRGDGLGQEHPAPVRDQRERRQPGALAPLAGDRQDRDDRQHDRHREPDRLRERVVGQVLVGGEQDRAHHGHDGRDDDARHQPEPGAGVEHLAQLDADDPAQGDRCDAGRAARWTVGDGGGGHAAVPFSLGVGGELEEHVLQAAVGRAQLGERHAGREGDLRRPGSGPRRWRGRRRRTRWPQPGGVERPAERRRVGGAGDAAHRRAAARPWSPGRRSGRRRSSRCRRR